MLDVQDLREPAEVEAEEIEMLSQEVFKLGKLYNALRTAAATRETKLEQLQIDAALGAKESLEADEEKAYLLALKGAAEQELEAVKVRAHNEAADAYQYDFMAARVASGVSENKMKAREFKEAVVEIDRKLGERGQASTELVNGCREAVRQHAILEAEPSARASGRPSSWTGCARGRRSLRRWRSGRGRRCMRAMSASKPLRSRRPRSPPSSPSRPWSTAPPRRSCSSARSGSKPMFDAAAELLGCSSVDECVDRIERASEAEEQRSNSRTRPRLRQPSPRTWTRAFRSIALAGSPLLASAAPASSQAQVEGRGDGDRGGGGADRGGRKAAGGSAGGTRRKMTAAERRGPCWAARCDRRWSSV